MLSRSQEELLRGSALPACILTTPQWSTDKGSTLRCRNAPPSTDAAYGPEATVAMLSLAIARAGLSNSRDLGEGGAPAHCLRMSASCSLPAPPPQVRHSGGAIRLVGQGVGASPGPFLGADGTMTEAAAEMLGRAAFLPHSLTRGASAGLKSILRARAFMARLIMQMQVIGIAAMVTSCGRLLRNGDGGSTHSVVVIGVSHSWDETKQSLREHRSEAQKSSTMKQPTTRIAKTVLVQTSMVNAVGIIRSSDGETQVFHRAESYLIPALETAGKTARHLAQAVLQSTAFPLHELERLRRVAAQVSGLVVALWGDAASTNRRMLKHICGLSEQDGWPTNVLIDPGQVCMLHQLHRVKTSCLEGHVLVSLSYCFARLIRAGSILGAVADSMADHKAQLQACGSAAAGRCQGTIPTCDGHLVQA